MNRKPQKRRKEDPLLKKLFVISFLMLALVFNSVSCNIPLISPDLLTSVETPTEDPTEEEPTEEATTETPTEEDLSEEVTTEKPTEKPIEIPTEKPTAKPTEAPTDPETDPMEPVNVFVAADISTVTSDSPIDLTQDCLTLEDGYIHVVPGGPDPYWYPFAGVEGARYVAIRYRTDATGADIQMYIGSTSNCPSDDSTMLRQPVIADSEWHVAIFDTQSIINTGKYDGTYVSYFRFDPLEAGYILDENGLPYKPDGLNYARYPLPEGCSIDVAYIGFFHNEDAVTKYDFDQYPPYVYSSDAGIYASSIDTF